MKIRRVMTSAILKLILRMFCRIDTKALRSIPMDGPLIICFNHINFLDAPLFQVFLQPRIVIGFAKKETWDTPVFKFIANTYDTISVDRGSVDLKAFRQVSETLKAGHMICLSPEGTRSNTGILQEGQAGVVTMAITNAAPILPLIHYGTEHFWENIKRFKRTRITFKAGEIFYISPGIKTNAAIRKNIIDEIMYQMALLLPENLSGVYSDMSQMSCKYLDFINNNS